MLACTLSSQRKNEVQFEKICNVGPYEENEQCGDGDVSKKGNEIVLDNFKKWETNQLRNRRLLFFSFFLPATWSWRWKSDKGERDRETERCAMEEFFFEKQWKKNQREMYTFLCFLRFRNRNGMQ